jgi:hypothetical protein
MNFSGVRVLTLVICAVTLFSLIGMGHTVAELEAIATDELVPEISAAAGIALASDYAKSKTEAELETLAATGATIGLRTAASQALSIVYRDKTEEELTSILTGSAAPMIRVAAIGPIQEYLISTTSEEEDFVLSDYLKGLATNGQTHEMRLAAAKAYYFVTRGTLEVTSLAEQARENDSDELAHAAGEALAGFYLSFNPKTQAELEELAINGESEGLRVAGGIALSTMLINSDLTAQELQDTLLSITGTRSAEYRDAYKAALAVRYET